jgi:hypothetical protein
MMNNEKHKALNGGQLCAEMGFSRWTFLRCKARGYKMKYGNRTTLEHLEQWLEANPFPDGRSGRSQVEDPRAQAAMLRMAVA